MAYPRASGNRNLVRHPPTPDRIINAAELRQIIPYSDMHFWRLERDGKFPRRIRPGANRVGWSLSEVSA